MPAHHLSLIYIGMKKNLNFELKISEIAETNTETETLEIEDDWIMQEMKIDTETEAAITIIEIGTSHQGKDLDLKTISGPMGMPMISLGSYIF